MSGISGHTFNYVNKHGQQTLSRMPAMDERYGRSWTNFHQSDSQQHLLASNATLYGMVGIVFLSSFHSIHYLISTHTHTIVQQSGEHQMATTMSNAQHAYAQPVRVIGGAGTTSRAVAAAAEYHGADYGAPTNNGSRSLKSIKGRSGTLATGHQGYPFAVSVRATLSTTFDISANNICVVVEYRNQQSMAATMRPNSARASTSTLPPIISTT